MTTRSINDLTAKTLEITDEIEKKMHNMKDIMLPCGTRLGSFQPTISNYLKSIDKEVRAIVERRDVDSDLRFYVSADTIMLAEQAYKSDNGTMPSVFSIARFALQEYFFKGEYVYDAVLRKYFFKDASVCDVMARRYNAANKAASKF